MKKLKLNIQTFSSTNSTTHYELSQYIGTDKPTYLVDYNSDMSKIDTGIYNADAKGTQANDNIGTMSNLTTTATTDLVSAINEVDAHADTNTTNISNNTTDIATNTSAIGTLANLQTTDKTNLVNAINELKGVNDTQNTNISKNASDINKLNLVNFKSYSSGTDITISGASVSGSDVTVATNSDGSLFKFYGQFGVQSVTGTVIITLTNTGIVPKQAFTVNTAGIRFDDNKLYRIDINVASNGDISFTIGATSSGRFLFIPCLYFANDFGDVPSSQV